ncbi:MAG: D-cysteine desulfhydrase family protein [Acidiferrobacterales bacterium]|nr:D-cysteine desulfhydrase family protein [Acidiferrobacterales bacterium]
MIADDKRIALDAALSRWPSERLGHFPTPLEQLPRLLGEGAAHRLWIKRDDCSGLGLGGNKVRQLEFYMGDAVAKGCDSVLSTGAVQSNYMRTLAAAAARLGFECHIQLENRVQTDDPDYANSGNVLLNKLFGAHLHEYGEGEDEHGADAALAVIADKLTQQGKRPYIVPLAPVPEPKGALGYVSAAVELAKQCDEQSIEPDLIVVGSGSSLTHAGLLTGCRALDWQVPVLGACVRRAAQIQRSRVAETCIKIEQMLELPRLVKDDDIWVSDIALAPGYGKASDEVLSAISAMASREGIIVDPVYSGKMVSCTLQLIENRALDNFQNIIMIHTGGTPAVFAYRKTLAAI